MALPSEHFLFRDYSKAVKTFIEEKLNISRYPKDENVLAIYGTPARAFSKYFFPMLNGSQVRPLVSFTLANITYVQGENLLGFNDEMTYNSITGQTRAVPPLLIYKLDYRLTIRTTLMSDMDILLYQTLINTSMNKKYATAVDGQWMELGFNGSPSNEITLEPGDVQDRMIRYGIDLSVPRAYLPREYNEDTGTIQSWQLEYELEDYING